MNYPRSTQMWHRGDRVIHDADAKTRMYVMVVEGVDPNQPDDHIVTRYADPTISKEIYVNHFSVLHDPSLFGINPDTIEDLWPHAMFHEGSRVAHRRTPWRTGQIMFIEGARPPDSIYKPQHYGRARVHWSIEQSLTGHHNSTTWVYLDELVPA